MSKLGHHNFFPRAHVTDAVIRALVLERSDSRFFSDEGDPPIVPERAYQLGYDSVWRFYQQPRVALPLDSFAPFDAGAAAAHKRCEEIYATEEPYPGYWDYNGEHEMDAVSCKQDAFYVAEFWSANDKLNQEFAMWEQKAAP